MSVRTDISVDWFRSPRLITVAAPSTTLTLQDLHDTLRALEETSEGTPEDVLVDSAGKDSLGGGLQVGITVTLQNAQLAFEARTGATAAGTATTASPTGTALIDSTAQFQTDGVVAGDIVLNHTDKSFGTVVSVDSETQLTMTPLTGGAENDWDIGDAYVVYGAAQCLVSGGNLVAVDGVGDPLTAIFPTANTQVNYAASTSAALITPDAAFRVGQAYDGFVFSMIAVTTRQPTAGLTVTGERWTGSAWVALTNAVVDIGGGDYSIDFAGADIPTTKVPVRFSASGAVTRTIYLRATE